MTADFLEEGGHPTRTDEAGGIVFPLLAPGSYRLRVSHEGHRTEEVSGSVREGEVTGLEITLRRE